MAGDFGNTEALGRLLAPGGFNPRLPPGLPGFVEFGKATFRAGASEAERPRNDTGLLGSLIYRPMVFRRNDIAWIAACAWRVDAKADDIAALKRAKRELDRGLIDDVAELVAALIHSLCGDRAADAIANVPCGHSRRSDCLGKQIAQAVAAALGLPFRQVFADRFCSGVSHPKEFAKLPPLERIADPCPSMILIDDLATSGWHLEESLTALRPRGRGIGVRVDHRSGDVRIGMVGSRRRTDRDTIEAAVGDLPIGTVVITGGAIGPDRWAEQAARTRGLEVIVHLPDLDGVRARWQAAKRFYALNQRIVDASDLVIAFVAPDRTGGTEDTIRRAVRAGKPVEVW